MWVCSEYSQSSALNGYVESVSDALDLCFVTVEQCADYLSWLPREVQLNFFPPLVGNKCNVCTPANCQPGQPSAVNGAKSTTFESKKECKCAGILLLLIGIGSLLLNWLLDLAILHQLNLYPTSFLFCSVLCLFCLNFFSPFSIHSFRVVFACKLATHNILLISFLQYFSCLDWLKSPKIIHRKNTT